MLIVEQQWIRRNKTFENVLLWENYLWGGNNSALCLVAKYHLSH